MDLLRRDEFSWVLPREGEMRGEGVVYSDEGMLAQVRGDGTLEQLRGVASLPGLVGAAMVMPDAHLGYGFPIGGVAAFDPEEGVVWSTATTACRPTRARSSAAGKRPRAP